MTRNARAVLCRELGKPVVVETIAIAAPRRDEVTVKIAACGVCHSDLSATNGTIQMKLPLVLGHEAAGTVAPRLTVDQTHLLVTSLRVKQVNAPESGVAQDPPPGALSAVPGPMFA